MLKEIHAIQDVVLQTSCKLPAKQNNEGIILFSEQFKQRAGNLGIDPRFRGGNSGRN